MNRAEPLRLAVNAAYGAAVLFTVSLARFFFIPGLGLPPNSLIVAELNGGLLPVAAHLLLFPVVAALPAPPWARAVGYGWLTINIMALNVSPTRSISPSPAGAR
jgi:hypothetical protein